MKTCEDCEYRDDYDGRTNFCVRYPPSYKINGNYSYPIISKKTTACGEHRLKEEENGKK